MGAAVLSVPVFVMASTSTNFVGTQESGGPVDFQATSPSYRFKAEVGHPGVGVSTSTNYTYWHGTFWEDGITGVRALVQWAVPEMRVGATSTNDDATFYLTVRDPATHAVVFTVPSLSTTTVEGKYLGQIPLTVTAGNYDVGVKTHQHLTKVLRGVNLSDGPNVLNFTQASNTAPFGTVRLLAGDVSGSTSSPATLGDDVVNSVDLSILINDLDRDDATNRGIRANLNQDPVVNSVDLSLMLKNLDVTGEQ